MIRTILVPLDGSEFAEHALQLSCELARGLNARLVLVCVAGPEAKLEQDLTEQDRRVIQEQYADRVVYRTGCPPPLPHISLIRPA